MKITVSEMPSGIQLHFNEEDQREFVRKVLKREEELTEDGVIISFGNYYAEVTKPVLDEYLSEFIK